MGGQARISGGRTGGSYEDRIACPGTPPMGLYLPDCTGHGPCDSAAAKKCMLSSRSEEHTSELQSRQYLVCRLLLEKKCITVLHSAYTPDHPAPHNQRAGQQHP